MTFMKDGGFHAVLHQYDSSEIWENVLTLTAIIIKYRSEVNEKGYVVYAAQGHPTIYIFFPHDEDLGLCDFISHNKSRCTQI